MQTLQKYNKENLFLASIKERFLLSHPQSSSQTYHIVLNLKGSAIEYQAGDCLAIIPPNDPQEVEDILSYIPASGKEEVLHKKYGPQPLKNVLIKYANLNKGLSGYPRMPLLDLLKTHSPISLSPQQFNDLLFPNLPRFYSIASSMKAVGEEAHLTVGLKKTIEGSRVTYGNCSHFLCCRASYQNGDIPLYLHKSPHFSLSPQSQLFPLIMIGAGTGIAPFRAFMQERISQKLAAPHWLFFGEKHQDYDFYYKDYWLDLCSKGQLKISLAFSRDQEQKVYVQHKLLENSKTLWQWIEEKKAFLFLCGDASKMSKNVEEALLQIFQKEGKKTIIEARSYLSFLRKQKRYLKDVY